MQEGPRTGRGWKPQVEMAVENSILNDQNSNFYVVGFSQLWTDPFIVCSESTKTFTVENMLAGEAIENRLIYDHYHHMIHDQFRMLRKWNLKLFLLYLIWWRI